jgi:magnesium transporter
MRILRSADVPELAALAARGECFWLDLDRPDRDILEAVGQALDLHNLALEDTLEFGQRPKLDVYDNQALLVYYGATDAPDGLPAPVEVHLHISAQFVISVHRDPCRQFEVVQEVLQRRVPDSQQVLVYRIVDALTDSLLDVLERVAACVDSYESRIFHRPRARDRDGMAVLRRSLGTLRRVLAIQRQVFGRAIERILELPGFDDELSTYYRDVGDHLWQAIDEIEAARDSLQGMLDTYTNEVQERLTIVATIFLPLTLLASFFGQNFNWMINRIGQAWAFWGLGVGGLVVACVGIVMWLLRSGLYNRQSHDR